MIDLLIAFEAAFPFTTKIKVKSKKEKEIVIKSKTLPLNIHEESEELKIFRINTFKKMSLSPVAVPRDSTIQNKKTNERFSSLSTRKIDTNVETGIMNILSEIDRDKLENSKGKTKSDRSMYSAAELSEIVKKLSQFVEIGKPGNKEHNRSIIANKYDTFIKK